MGDFKKLIKPYMFIDKKLGITEYKPDMDKIELMPFDRKIWEQKFPLKLKSATPKLKNLQLTNVGVYSIGTPKIVEYLSTFLLELIDILICKKVIFIYMRN